MNLARIVERHAAFAPGQVALHFEGEDISYPQLWQRVEQATAVLQSAGVRPGDRVAWLGLNDPSMLVLLFGLARIGAILLPLNYRLAAAEHTAILAHAGAGMLVADETHAAVAEALCASRAHRPCTPNWRARRRHAHEMFVCEWGRCRPTQAHP